MTTQQGSFPAASSGRTTLLLLWGVQFLDVADSWHHQCPQRAGRAPHPAGHDRMLAPELTG
jgi:hypothetical protein